MVGALHWLPGGRGDGPTALGGGLAAADTPSGDHELQEDGSGPSFPLSLSAESPRPSPPRTCTGQVMTVCGHLSGRTLGDEPPA